MTAPRTLAVITRRDCELCMELAEMLQPYIIAGLVSVMERDVDSEAALYAAHNFRVPVVLEGDREILWGRVSPAELIAAFGHHDVDHRQT